MELTAREAHNNPVLPLDIYLLFIPFFECYELLILATLNKDIRRKIWPLVKSTIVRVQHMKLDEYWRSTLSTVLPFGFIFTRRLIGRYDCLRCLRDTNRMSLPEWNAPVEWNRKFQTRFICMACFLIYNQENFCSVAKLGALYGITKRQFYSYKIPYAKNAWDFIVFKKDIEDFLESARGKKMKRFQNLATPEKRPPSGRVKRIKYTE